MSATISQPPLAATPSVRRLRFCTDAGQTDGSLHWNLKRNCSTTPRQMIGFFASLSSLSLGIALFCWVQGATLVMPFAWIEMAALGTALLVYARHAADSESIRLHAGRLIVEHVSGQSVERAEFAPGWVRVEPEQGERSLVELSGQGQRIAVGRFVRPELRRALADELRWALRRSH